MEVRGHRAFVCAASPALGAAVEEQLRRDPAASASGDVRVVMGADVQAADFRLLLRYMYSGAFAPGSAAVHGEDGGGQSCVGVGDRRRVGALAQALGLRQLAAALQVQLPTHLPTCRAS